MLISSLSLFKDKQQQKVHRKEYCCGSVMANDLLDVVTMWRASSVDINIWTIEHEAMNEQFSSWKEQNVYEQNRPQTIHINMLVNTSIPHSNIIITKLLSSGIRMHKLTLEEKKLTLVHSRHELRFK